MSQTLNSIMLEGNLTRDPEARKTPRGTSLCTFSVATSRFYRTNNESQKEISFFDIETWSDLAERCEIELKKGRGVRVIGRLKQDRWIDTEGKNRNSVKIVADHVEFKKLLEKTPLDEKDDLVEKDRELAMIL